MPNIHGHFSVIVHAHFFDVHGGKKKHWKSQIVPEKICKFLPEKILKVPEKKYKLKNTRENLKKSAREATREKIEKNPFLGHFFFSRVKKKTLYHDDRVHDVPIFCTKFHFSIEQVNP